MASIKDLIDGLTLLAKYEEKGNEAQINGADHDIIYGGGEPLKWSEEDRARMDVLGWHVYNFDNYDDEKGEYVLDEDAIWARFV